MTRRKIALTIIGIISLTLVYHLLIITQLIPYDAAWGGRLQNEQQMIRFEAVSIIINLFIMLLVAIKGSLITIKFPQLLLKVLLWLLVVIFILNTVGNVFSNNKMEALIFTPITLLLAILTAWLATKKS